MAAVVTYLGQELCHLQRLVERCPLWWLYLWEPWNFISISATIDK
jgi:hypothetical protein